jgi:hypothetical protein
LADVLGDHLLQEPAVARHLLGLDLDVDRMAVRTTVRLVQQDPRVRERVALSLVPASTSTAAGDAAWPMTMVDTSGLMHCIVS